MTEHYVTLFDSGFLPNGLALHSSLERHAGDYALWVVCMDEKAFEVLSKLALPHVRPVRLAEVETPELMAVKSTRSFGEYCWTLTPFTPDVVFDRDPEATRATYIDADMWLVGSPRPILDEFESSGAAVLITDHAYAPEFEHMRRYGTYCVQFMPFERGGSDRVRRWWQERVLEWCYAHEEDGKFGDQKYLEDWPERFGTLVHVLQATARTQAPWNAVAFPARDASVFHFHRLRIVSGTRVTVGLYRLPRDHQRLLYRPYLRDLRSALTVLAQHGQPFSPQAAPLHGWAAVKDRIAFRMLNWRSPTTPYSMTF
jgi:hypothetical protein